MNDSAYKLLVSKPVPTLNGIPLDRWVPMQCAAPGCGWVGVDAECIIHAVCPRGHHGYLTTDGPAPAPERS
jgi:hypothetical protein